MSIASSLPETLQGNRQTDSIEDINSPCGHSLLDIFQKTSVKFVERINVREEESQGLLRHVVLLAHLVSEPLKQEVRSGQYNLSQV